MDEYLNNYIVGDNLEHLRNLPPCSVDCLYTDRNTVLDIFAGSGTVGRSCIALNRSYILFDISENAKNVFEQSINDEKHTEQDVIG
jgi:DNA modification methylase